MSYGEASYEVRCNGRLVASCGSESEAIDIALRRKQLALTRSVAITNVRAGYTVFVPDV